MTDTKSSVFSDMCAHCFNSDRQLLQVHDDHSICPTCLEDLLTRAMSDEKADETAYPPKCCDTVIPFEMAKPSLSKEVVQEYEKKLDHLKERETDVEKVYCAEATCTKYIPPGDRAKGVAKCPHCKAETCCHCKKLAHFGDCGDGDQDQGDMPSLF